MTYYKHKLTFDEDNPRPPVHSGIILCYDCSREDGVIMDLVTGSHYKFAEADLLTTRIFIDARVVFSITRSGHPYGIKGISNKTVTL